MTDKLFHKKEPGNKIKRARKDTEFFNLSFNKDSSPEGRAGEETFKTDGVWSGTRS